ncbi:MAG: cytochrome b N-terminal domain-containing protein [Acidobacteria bacterium]|nr:cytochrome b N-terminal domain-containing protein [Acidobacteriota bacterium]
MRRGRLAAWLDERLGWSHLMGIVRHKTVPVHRHSLWYYLGGMTLFFFLVQAATGILLMLYYRPSADEAYESVQFIVTRVEFGWLVRSIHSWSANLMVGAALAHLFSVYCLRAYRRPRELTWVSGILLLLLALGFGFSGYLLPWNELAYFATKVGTDIAGSLPFIGEWILRFLRGGDRVTGATLSRFYGWHVAILPALTTMVLGLHLLLVQKHGMSVPPSEARPGPARAMPFLPNFLLRDLFGWTLALAALAGLAAYAPWELGVKADPFAPAPADIRPEWYFLFMFETLKLLPGGTFLGVEYEAIAILGFLLAGALLCLVPLIDRGEGDGKVSRIFLAGGWVALAYVAVMTWVGSRSPWPVLVLAGALTLAWRLRSRRIPVLLIAGAGLLLVPGGTLAAAPPEDSCVACHRTLAGTAQSLVTPVEAWVDDIHRSNGLGCAACHGGDPAPSLSGDAEAAMSPAKGFVARPPVRRVAEFCGRCHSDPGYMKKFNPAARVDQVAEYRTSVHGVRNAAGDEKVATCTDCHGAHGIRPVSSPRSPAYPTNVPATCGACHADPGRMMPYGRRGNPLEEWRKSVHATALLKKGDLSAPACNDCHGNHGAVPPGVTSLAFVCGQCHGREALLFRESFKKDLFDASGASECVTCHGNHEILHPTDRLIGTGEGTVCGQCHEPGDACDRQSVEVRAAIDWYAGALGEAQEVLARAERAGMEVSEALFTLKKEGVSGLVETRALIHSFDTGRLVGRAEEGVKTAGAARAAGERALAELQFRRKGLAVSIVFIGLLLGGLYLKIREVDARGGGAA